MEEKVELHFQSGASKYYKMNIDEEQQEQAFQYSIDYTVRTIHLL